MNITYFITKDEYPFVKFAPVIRLQKNKIKNWANINSTYDNNVKHAEMICEIADQMKQSFSAKLKATNYLAILIDGDTDISNTDCEIVYVHLLKNGKPVTLRVRQQLLKHSHAIGKLLLHFIFYYTFHIFFFIENVKLS